MQPLTIAGRIFSSRLFIGTGKFGAPDIMADAVRQSGAELVTVALRRVDLNEDAGEDPMLSRLNPEAVVIVPNTSGARTAEEAVRIARLAKAAAGLNWVKLELTPDPNWLLPDPVETLKAAELNGVKIVVGGAPITQGFADEIGADGFSPDAASAVNLARGLVGVN